MVSPGCARMWSKFGFAPTNAHGFVVVFQSLAAKKWPVCKPPYKYPPGTYPIYRWVWTPVSFALAPPAGPRFSRYA
jgi:hypothetical protein